MTTRRWRRLCSWAHGGIATSGRGPRDRVVGDKRLSPTLSPVTGWAVETNISATVMARSAADADALATAALVSNPETARAIFGRRQDAGARIVAPDGSVAITGVWAGREQPAPVQIKSPGMWPDGWQALATFTAPTPAADPRSGIPFALHGDVDHG